MEVKSAFKVKEEPKECNLLNVAKVEKMDFHIDKQRKPFLYHIKEVASVGMEKVKSEIDSYSFEYWS